MEQSIPAKIQQRGIGLRRAKLIKLAVIAAWIAVITTFGIHSANVLIGMSVWP